jgi:hypothetical protein
MSKHKITPSTIRCVFQDGSVDWDIQTQQAAIVLNKDQSKAQDVTIRNEILDIPIDNETNVRREMKQWNDLLDSCHLKTENLKEIAYIMLACFYLSGDWSPRIAPLFSGHLPILVDPTGVFSLFHQAFINFFPTNTSKAVKSSIFALEDFIPELDHLKTWIYNDNSQLSPSAIQQMLSGEQMVIPRRFRQAYHCNWPIKTGFGLLTSPDAKINLRTFGFVLPNTAIPQVWDCRRKKL